MVGQTEVLFRKATPPEDPRMRWRGFEPGRTLLSAGTVHVEGARPLPCDIVLDRDVEMSLRDGTRIYLDVYRPVGDDPVPAVLAWSPYGKQGGTTLDDHPARAGVARSVTSGLEKFEGPDPAFWCERGYAVVNIDTRGSWASEGDIQVFSTLEAQDGYDVVEWLAAQDWCADAVVMSGNSWLGISQFRIAATRPPHLAAIAPWEGLTDVYRDLVRQGGMPRIPFSEALVAGTPGHGLIEDLTAMAIKQPLMNDYWRSKITDIEAIEAPAYVVASWTNPAHTRGTLDAFTRMDPSRTWLRVHNTHEWPDLYEYEEDLLKFFDHVVKGVDNGWDQTPRVRLSVYDPGGEDQVNRPEESYPLARAEATALYLDAAKGGLSLSLVADEGSVEYDPAEETVSFDYGFEQDAEIVGPMKLRLWLEVDGGSDADLFVYVQKTDANGEPLLPFVRAGVPDWGAPGSLRVSRRELDPRRSTPLVPVHTHERELPVPAGEAVPVEIEIWPYGMAWHVGQRLRVIVSGKDMAPRNPSAETVNTGIHRIRTGGSFDSHLLVPLVPGDRTRLR